MNDIALRPPHVVMQPAWMGAVRLTRYSFNRMLIRRAFRERWQVALARLDLDDDGCGETHFDVSIDDREFSFVAFTTTLDESTHTDRVIAESWEISAALCEGRLDHEFLAELRHQVPRQEQGRFDDRVLVLTRGNRSVRFFDYLVNTLAEGNQPDPTVVGDAGYIMRSTAFYGNGAFGMRSFEALGADHPLGAPYRAQFLAAWLFRELSYVVVEHCARARGGERAASFDDGWARFFGLGNATGLGLVPYAFKHPAVIDAWARVREQALAEVRALPGTEARLDQLRWWSSRAVAHFATGTTDDTSPFLNAAALHDAARNIAEQVERGVGQALPFDALYRWAESQGPETAEFVVSLLVELHDGGDRDIDAAMRVEEGSTLDPATTVAEIRSRIADWYPWLDSVVDTSADPTTNDKPTADNWYWWLITDNTNEPRRAPRARLAPDGRDVPVDVALRLARLAQALASRCDDEPIHNLLVEEPEHRFAVDRLARRFDYGEPIDNACARSYMPLMVQRFQLAMYGMDNFKPKSTDWLRVTLYQGAPRIADLAEANPAPELIDGWVWPPLPRPEGNTQ